MVVAVANARIDVIVLDRAHMVAVFNEWARQYAENPSVWLSVLDENGKPYDDYGEKCTAMYCKISDEIAPDKNPVMVSMSSSVIDPRVLDNCVMLEPGSITDHPRIVSCVPVAYTDLQPAAGV